MNVRGDVIPGEWSESAVTRHTGRCTARNALWNLCPQIGIDRYRPQIATFWNDPQTLGGLPRSRRGPGFSDPVQRIDPTAQLRQLAVIQVARLFAERPRR